MLNKTVYYLRMPPWTPSDSQIAMVGEARYPVDLCERPLGHALPTVARTYDTGSYLEQRREALEKWAAYLERIASSGAPVVALPSGASAPRVLM
jgi:hypothetical protein